MQISTGCLRNPKARICQSWNVLSITSFAIASGSPQWKKISRAILWIRARFTKRSNTPPNYVIKMRTLDEKLTVRGRELQLKSTRSSGSVW